MGPGSQGRSGNLSGVTVSGPTPRSGIAYRSPSRSGRAPQAVKIRAKGPVSSDEPTKDVPQPSGKNKALDIPEDEDERDERLRREEDKRVELRAKKRDVKEDTNGIPEGKKIKYAVRVKEDYDVEEMMDRILEGHNHLMNLKDVLASAPRLWDDLKARLSRKMVASVRLGVIIPKEAEWTETGTKMDWKSVACGCLDVVVKGKTCTTTVDTGAEMNLIKEEHALRLGMEIDRSYNGVLMRANKVRSFLGTCGFWRMSIKGFAAKTEQLRKFVPQGQNWVWGDKQESVIEGLKKEFEEGGLVLGVPDHATVMIRPFIVETDAGPTALGGVLIQRDFNGEERPLREGRKKEHKSHKHEREEEQHAKMTQRREGQPAERTHKGGASGRSGTPPQPAQTGDNCPMPDMEPDLPHEPQGQEQEENQATKEKEMDSKERVAREKEIRVHLRLKYLAELHEKMQLGERPMDLKDRKGKGVCTQGEDLPLLTEAWVNFDKLMEAARRPREHHEEMGVKLVSTDLLSLKGLKKESFAAAKASYQKVGERLTKVAHKAYGQRVD
ncbi:hypothetical protein CBR_g23974 [Chara braunii]|uniref:Reverse transcriptase/retrotransposon-derived protein RNase H-like domain-containing protein n=1 Tax=Chara braunii TaxID=69332 RepID=A0A388L5C6_CHABU|nr:hypothetical protein CBR_g23974 [Chara braunii]|eukprot:GBG77529.1 hypothetical protein CBR_g23974 [Chara braunii]